ncbi:MAG: hypothetical protein NTZ24_07370 [Deltaproteobacteria bacterium]|nr:hypothetical protein [Deltaproteobacteria bacterium]
MKSRKKEGEKAEALIEEEVAKYLKWYNALEVVPTIVSLRQKLEAIVKAELARSGSWLQNLTDEEQKDIEILAGSIINKILHDPITGLKEESQDQSALPYIAAVRRLFGLDNT